MRNLLESYRGSDAVVLQTRARVARRLFIQSEDPIGEAISLLSVGWWSIADGDPDSAHASFDRALELVHDTGDVAAIAMVRIAEATSWRAARQPDEAAAKLVETVAVLEQLECHEDATFTLQVFQYFAPAQFTPEVLDQAQPLLGALQPMLTRSLQSTALVELAGVHKDSGRLELALRTLDRAQGLDPGTNIATILVEKADIELALRRPQRGLELYLAAQPLARHGGDLSLQARILWGLADVYEHEGEMAKAIDHRHRAEAIMPPKNEGTPFRQLFALESDPPESP